MNKDLLIVIGIVISVSVVVSMLWVNGIDEMNDKHKDYEGDDFLNY